MPAYYDTSFPITTNAVAATQSSGPHLTLKTGTAVAADIKGVYAGSKASSIGGALIRVMTLTTASSSSGGTVVPARRNPATSAAATTSALSSQTGPGSTPTQRLAVGFAQTGGPGGWVAIEPDAAIHLSSGGGANGNADVNSFANAASVTADLTVEFSEA